ncbi:hypothetical protein PVAP13_1KG320005 [Panicum virgatum]|uniref:Spt5 KOW domain-containing protein n=1 Tax=Panicum virgatum TaxID=38727 RepID=A0A8T0XBC4_PANVG|nr:hypothetical protein PVAP13_1KG320005 [Panicum virgatum]
MNGSMRGVTGKLIGVDGSVGIVRVECEQRCRRGRHGQRAVENHAASQTSLVEAPGKKATSLPTWRELWIGPQVWIQNWKTAMVEAEIRRGSSPTARGRRWGSKREASATHYWLRLGQRRPEEVVQRGAATPVRCGRDSGEL